MTLLPGWARLRHYEIGWLRADAVAGLTVGAMLIPQAMAYAELAGMAPQHGFYAAIGALVVYALAGSSRHLGVGPEPGTAILAATGVGAIAGGDPARYVALMAALALAVSGLCLIGAAARLGILASVLSKPVLVGYITGVGVMLLSSQVAGFSRVPIPSDDFVPRIRDLVVNADQVHGPTVAVAAGTLAVIMGFRRWAPRMPGALAGVAVAMLIVAVFSLQRNGIAVVGAIPAGLPVPGVPNVSLGDVRQLLPVAAGIALVGYADNVLTARSIAASRGYRIDANQELLALGLTNLSSGLSHGFPISSSASRTAVPAFLGSKTQLVSLVAAAFVVMSLLVLRPTLADIPRPALAAVIVSAAFAIIDVAGFRSLWRVSREEFVLAVATALGVLLFNVLVGVLVAVVLSIVVALDRIARPTDAILGDAPGLDGWVDVGTLPGALTEPGLVVYRFDAPLCFVNADRFCERVEQVLDDYPGRAGWLVIDFEGIGALDATALDAVTSLLDRLRERGVVVVAAARANRQVLRRLERASLLAPIGALVVFPTINSAVSAYRQQRDGAGGPPDHRPTSSGPSPLVGGRAD
jgi:high affinity sulfate transporter 1